MFLRLHSIEVPIESKKDILRDFFCRAAIAENAKRDAEDP